MATHAHSAASQRDLTVSLSRATTIGNASIRVEAKGGPTFRMVHMDWANDRRSDLLVVECFFCGRPRWPRDWPEISSHHYCGCPDPPLPALQGCLLQRPEDVRWLVPRPPGRDPGASVGPHSGGGVGGVHLGLPQDRLLEKGQLGQEELPSVLPESIFGVGIRESQGQARIRGILGGA